MIHKDITNKKLSYRKNNINTVVAVNYFIILSVRQNMPIYMATKTVLNKSRHNFIFDRFDNINDTFHTLYSSQEHCHNSDKNEAKDV